MEERVKWLGSDLKTIPLAPAAFAQIQRLKLLVGDMGNPALLVVDGCSFLNPTIIHHVDARMIQFCNSTLPFGGRVVVLRGHASKTADWCAVNI